MNAKITRTTPRALLLAAGLITALAAESGARACEACNKALINQLLAGQFKSPQAAEMLSLVKGAMHPRSGPMLFASAGSTVVNPLVASAATTPAAPLSAAAAGGIPQAAPPPAPKPSAHPFADIIERDSKLPIPPTGYVLPGTKPDKKFTIELSQGETFIGNGVVYRGFTTNGTIPGPTFMMDEGDVIEFTVVNKGTVPHGVSIHAAYTQTSKYYGKIPPGESRTHLWRASYPGVYMYHCAPGGHAIPMHIMFGQYGMMIVKPKKPYKMEEVLGKKPDIEIFLLQHELYSNGRDAIDGKPAYVLFNGKMFRYAESPVKARPGDFVRVYFLNVGPNLIATFHLVGIVWDYAYWQGSPAPENLLVGGQSVLAGPTDSWVVDFRVPPDEGAYLMLTHAVGSADRGAIGILSAEKDATRTEMSSGSQGPIYTPQEMSEFTAKAVRTIAMFEPGSDELSDPYVLPLGQRKATVRIIGNSFYPKVLSVLPGTTVEWVNEDTFMYFEGEFAGIHNVATLEAPEAFVSPMLPHAARFKKTLNAPGEYKYMCAPHPYMKGVIRVE